MEELKLIKVPATLFEDLVEDRAKLKAIKAYTQGSQYGVDRQAIADICGFELRFKDGEKNGMHTGI